MLVCFLLFFWDRIILCSNGWPGTYYINQIGLRLTEIHLLIPVLRSKGCPTICSPYTFFSTLSFWDHFSSSWKIFCSRELLLSTFLILFYLKMLLWRLYTCKSISSNTWYSLIHIVFFIYVYVCACVHIKYIQIYLQQMTIGIVITKLNTGTKSIFLVEQLIWCHKLIKADHTSVLSPKMLN